MATQRFVAILASGEFSEVATTAVGGTASYAGLVPVLNAVGVFDASIVPLPAVVTNTAAGLAPAIASAPDYSVLSTVGQTPVWINRAQVPISQWPAQGTF